MKYLPQMLLFVVAVAVLSVLQYRLWFAENGRRDYAKLEKQIEYQQTKIDAQIEQNRILKADVKDLKNGLEAVEEHARLDLGLIKPNETFVQVSASSTKDAGAVAHYNKGRSRADTVESIPEPLDTKKP